MTNLIDRLYINLDHAEYVTIYQPKLGEFCHLLVKSSLSYRPFDWRGEFWLEDAYGKSAVSQFFTILSAVNFRFWQKSGSGLRYTYGVRHGKRLKGALYLAKSLKLAITQDRYPLLDAKALSKISFSDFREIIRDDRGNVFMPAIGERVKNLQDLGRKLYDYWGGEFYNLVKSCRGSLWKFVQLSRQFRAFDDPLAKLPMLNAVFHQGRGLTRFRESKYITLIDYHLPNLMCRMGILIPRQRLAAKLKSYELLTSGEALGLRRAGLRVCVHTIEKTGIRGDVLDNILWFTGSKICFHTKCGECRFDSICSKRTDFKIPLERTRWY